MGIVNRVSTAYHSPRNIIPMYWGTAGTVFNPAAGQTNPFSVSGSVNPNTAGPNSGPIPVQQATCRSGPDGNCTIALTTGFTPPVTLIAWEYNPNLRAWIKLGPAAAVTGGYIAYQAAIDALYSQWTFGATENSYILIQSSAAITGAASTDGSIDSPKVGAGLQGTPS